MPQVFDFDLCYLKSFDELRANRLDQLSPILGFLNQFDLFGRGFHIAFDWCNYLSLLSVAPQLLLIFVQKAFISRNYSAKAFNESSQMINIVSAGGQQRKMRYHSRARNSQAEFEAVIIQVFSGAMPVMGERRLCVYRACRVSRCKPAAARCQLTAPRRFFVRLWKPTVTGIRV